MTGSIETNDVFQTIGVTPNYEIVLNFIEKNLGQSANWFDFNHYTRGNKDIIHLRHELGYKWSVFVANEVATIFQTILKKETKIEVFDNCATIEVTV